MTTFPSDMEKQNDWIGQPQTVIGAANVERQRKVAEQVPLTKSQRLVYDAIKARGLQGATSSEIADDLNAVRDSVSPRFEELHKKLLVMRLPGRRNEQKIWRAVYL